MSQLWRSGKVEVVISGSGVYTPEHVISNQELVAAFNQYVDNFNLNNEDKIAQGLIKAKEYSNCEFIEKASGIKSRYVIEKEGILDPNIMYPVISEKSDDSISIQAEISIAAAQQAMEQANKSAGDIDAVICSCSNHQRAYPAMAIEIQQQLAIQGFAYDMNVACSSATFALANAKALIDAKLARCVLVVTPEICSAHLNFTDRDSHFIFGDVATAVIVESKDILTSSNAFLMRDVKLFTQFSSNVRNNAGFMNRLWPSTQFSDDKLFYQNGRKVFKEVTLSVVELITNQLKKMDLTPQQLPRMWLHQANIHMNRLIFERLYQQELDRQIAPIILDEYANTAGAGSIIAFNKYQHGINSGDHALLCSFGAGYSIGSIVLQKL